MKSMVSRVPKAQSKLQNIKRTKPKPVFQKQHVVGMGRGHRTGEAEIRCTSTDSKEFKTDRVGEEFH